MKHLRRATRWMALVSTALTLLQSLVSAQPILSVTGKDELSGGWLVIFNGQGYASSWTLQVSRERTDSITWSTMAVIPQQAPW